MAGLIFNILSENKISAVARAPGMRLHVNFFSLSLSLDGRLPKHFNISLCNLLPVAIICFKYLPILVLLCFQAMTISQQDNENVWNQVFVIDFMVEYHGKVVSKVKIV